MKRTLQAIVLLFATLGPLVGCSASIFSDEDYGTLAGDNGHSCTIIRANNSWLSHFLYLHHQDTRSCPAVGTIHVGDYVSAGGIITQAFDDYNFCHPITFNPASCNVAVHATIDVYNTDSDCTESAFGTAIANSRSDFRQADWTQNGDPSTWGTGVYTSFPAGTGGNPNYDCPDFIVEISQNSYSTFPEVVSRIIKYNVELM